MNICLFIGVEHDRRLRVLYLLDELIPLNPPQEGKNGFRRSQSASNVFQIQDEHRDTLGRPAACTKK